MRSEDEQIEVLLRGDLTAWVQEQIAFGSEMNDLTWNDFLSVTPERVTQHALERGFPVGAVWTAGQPPTEKNDRLVVESTDAGTWRVYYTERGDVDDERRFATREEAYRDAVDRVMASAWVRLNHNYWNKHHREGDVFPPLGGAMPPKR
jgi:hypothetical protein